MKFNGHYFELTESYLFATVAQKSAEYAAAHPDKKVLKLSIGDVTLPLVPAVIAAMHAAVDEMGVKETFKSMRRIFSSPTAQSRTAATFWRFSIKTIRCWCPIPSIPCM